ncbi:MAG: hypothetical protein N3D12_05600 [Candidatus Methanomethyliaceae archaeon]|nr:hypothetical protein [Candidatus Methanomethyliaceae archaeon]
MRGNIPLIDALAALIIVLTIFSLVGQYGVDYRKIMRNYIEREEARALFYQELFLGRVQWSDFSDNGLLPNGLIVAETPPHEGSLKFFLSHDWGMKVYFICKGE